MATTIYCKTTAKDVHTFYLLHGGKDYFLFNQNFRKGVKEFFRWGVPLNCGMDFSRSKGNSALKKTMEKLPAYIRYIEKEYGIAVLEQTKKKNKLKGSYAVAA